jgi:hypothetical protein
MKNVPHTFSDLEYSIVTLLGFKKLIKRSDYHLGFVPARSVLDDSPTQSEVSQALDFAISILRERLTEGGNGN